MTELINLSKAKEMLNLIDGEFSDEGSCPECGSEVLRCKDCVIKLIEQIYNSIKDNVDCELAELEGKVRCKCGLLKVETWEGEIKCPSWDKLEETDIASNKKWDAWYEKHGGGDGDSGDLALYQERAKNKTLVTKLMS